MNNKEAIEKIKQELSKAIELLMASEWREGVPRSGTFLCRRVSEPWITFEACVEKEQDGWENPEYRVLVNLTNENDILDGHWDKEYEWQPLPTKEGA